MTPVNLRRNGLSVFPTACCPPWSRNTHMRPLSSNNYTDDTHTCIGMRQRCKHTQRHIGILTQTHTEHTDDFEHGSCMHAKAHKMLHVW